MRRRWCSGVGLAMLGLVGASCEKPTAFPVVPEFTSAQTALWKLAPADAAGGVVIADLGHLIGRLGAFETALETGPATRAKLAPLRAQLRAKIGFDLFDLEGWRTAGLDPSGPLAVFALDEHNVQLVFRATDAMKATQTITSWVSTDVHEPLECAPVGTYLHCGTPGWKLADDAAHSLFAHVEANLTAADLAMELVLYVPLDRGKLGESLAKPDAPVKGLHAAYAGLTLSPERFVLRGGARVDDAKRVLPFLKPRDGKSLLGLAAGATGATRITFAPDALWALAKDTVGDKLDAGLGMVQAATGLDIEKDLIDNLTGEIVAAGYRTERGTGADGKPLSLVDRMGNAMVIGTRDDQRTRKISERLGGVLGGAVGSYGDMAEKLGGIKLAFRTEAGDRPVSWLTIDLTDDKQKALLGGISHLELFLTSIPGGVAVGGKSALGEMKKRIGKQPAAFLDGLPLPAEREMFSRSAFVIWNRIGEGFGARVEMAEANTAMDDLVPGARELLVELTSLGQLLYDGVMSIDVSADRAEVFYQLTLL